MNVLPFPEVVSDGSFIKLVDKEEHGHVFSCAVQQPLLLKKSNSLCSSVCVCVCVCVLKDCKYIFVEQQLQTLVLSNVGLLKITSDIQQHK